MLGPLIFRSKTQVVPCRVTKRSAFCGFAHTEEVETSGAAR